MFYTNAYTKQTAQEIAGIFQKKDYRYRNIHFLTCDESKSIPQGSIFIYDDQKCLFLPVHTPPNIIGRLNDGGMIFGIANDTVCESFKLKRYTDNLHISDFSIEHMSVEQFCKTFITKY